MAKDDRLDLGRYIQNPFNRRGQIAKRLNFDDLFRSEPESGQYPWNPSRFGQQDLMRRAMTRKMTLNPELEFVGNTPFFMLTIAANTPTKRPLLLPVLNFLFLSILKFTKKNKSTLEVDDVEPCQELLF